MNKSRKLKRTQRRFGLPTSTILSAAPADQARFASRGERDAHVLTTTFSDEHAHSSPYDPELLDRARMQWQFGDWESLTQLDLHTLEHHPERAKLALVVATAWQQTNDHTTARRFIKLAKEWGCDKKLMAQLLVAGVHNTLGCAAIVNKDEQRAARHFLFAVKGGGGDERLTNHARRNGEQRRLSATPTKKLHRPADHVIDTAGVSRIRKILVTGDFLRPSLEGGLSQEDNIRWLFSLIEPQLRAVIDPYFEDESTFQCFSGDLVLAQHTYAALGLPFTEHSWAKLYADPLHSSFSEVIRNLVGDDNSTLVIGFEMPPTMLDYLTASGIPYINIRISPFRYLDDLLLSFSSNDAEMSERLTAFVTPQTNLFLAASIEKHKRRFAPLTISPRSIVFFGQAPRDASLIESGTFASYKNHKESITSIASGFDARYYKPHPFVRDEDAISFFLDLGFEVIDDNAYDLLSAGALDAVLGMNSSVLYEAICFKKTVFRLHAADLYEGSVHIYGSFLGVDFWSTVLGKDIAAENSTLVARPNLLRESLGAWWAKVK
jgi:hypothetical protein